MSNEKEPDNKSSVSWWLVAAIVLTAVYLGVIWYIGNISAEVKACPKSTWSAITSGCLALNELGDFLAGAFAPLAFIWLAAAVLIQSQELKEQRKELRLTRESMEDNREVMRAQADEARKQAEYIGQQTKLMEDDQRSRKDDEHTRNFEAAVGQIVALLKTHRAAIRFSEQGNVNNKLGRSTPVADMQNEADEVNELRVASNIITNNFLSEHRKNFIEGKLDPVDAVGFCLVYDACSRALELRELIPLDAKITAEAMNLDEFMTALSHYAQKSGLNKHVHEPDLPEGEW